jgi:hypothetical protein
MIVASIGYLSGIGLDDELEDQGFKVQAGTGNFSLHHRVKTGSGTHPPSYPIGSRGSFLGGKSAEV